MNKTEKSLFVDNLTIELKDASSIVLVDYIGLGVKMQQELKRRLKTVSAEMQIIKNTLLKLAGTKAGSPKEILEDTVLSGPTAIIITTADPIAPLQVLSRFASEFEIPNFKVGIVEGRFQNKESLEILSKLPSKDVLLAQVSGTVGAPLYALVGTLQGNLQKLIYLLETKIKQV